MGSRALNAARYIGAAMRTFAAKMFLAWFRLFLGFCVLMLFVGGIEASKLIVARELGWGELPAFLLHAAPSMFSLALLGSVGLLAVIVVIVGPIVWFSRRDASPPV